MIVALVDSQRQNAPTDTIRVNRHERTVLQLMNKANQGKEDVWTYDNRSEVVRSDLHHARLGASSGGEDGPKSRGPALARQIHALGRSP
jgi:hypothetical protein